jgi:hypothetical protein
MDNQTLGAMSGVSLSGGDQQNIYKESCFPIDFTKAIHKPAPAPVLTLPTVGPKPKPVAIELPPVNYQACAARCLNKY